MVKLAVDTAETVPDAPPAAGPDRALDAPPPDAFPAPPCAVCPVVADGDALADGGSGQTDGQPEIGRSPIRPRAPDFRQARGGCGPADCKFVADGTFASRQHRRPRIEPAARNSAPRP
jgi:hypothetical protein